MSNLPASKTVIVLDGKPKEVLMSFGLLNSLMEHINNPVDVLALSLDPELSRCLISECLAERTEEGAILRTPNLYNLATEDAEKMLSWIADHISHFFVKTLSQNPDQLRELKKMLETPQPSGLTGSAT